MASAVGIANKALTLLGQQPITSFSDDNSRGRAVNRTYDELRREMLASHPWNFAYKRASLAADSTAPTHTFARRFAFPTDCLRLLDADTESERYGVEGRYIVTDAAAPLRIEYIADIDDPNQMSPGFRRCLSYALAAELAFEMTGNATLQQSMASQAERESFKARSQDAQEGEFYEQDEGTWLESRL